MRLICPNCGAHYAIDPRIIPEAGRDVQCSACGHTWFQTRATEQTTPVPRAAKPQVPDAVPPPLDPPKREIDPEVMSVLREEAALERAARQAERSSLEVQSNFDLAEPPAPAPSAAPPPEPAPPEPALPKPAPRTAAVDPAPAPQAPAPRPPEVGIDENDPALRPAPRPGATAPRGSLLPDIEEINSTLEPAEHATAASQIERPEPPSARIARVRRGQGRRIGFGLACLIFGIATVLYSKGPEIGAAVPAFAPSLDAYVSTVQDGRVWLDGLFRRAGGVGTES